MLAGRPGTVGTRTASGPVAVFWRVSSAPGRAGRHEANPHIGDSLTGQNADAVEILAITTRGRHARVYNLTVADLHAYYVR